MLATLITALITTSPVYEPIRIGDLICHPRRLLAKFETLREAEKSIPKRSKILQWIPELNIAIIETPVKGLVSTRKWMKKRGVAEWVEFDRAALPAYEPNDPMWPDMWHMTAIKADKAWDYTHGSSDVVVAVIDTGVMLTHEDLAANIWVNPGEIAGNGIDDDNNGYIDDVNGYDFAYGDSDPDDVYGHGTACAGIVAAIQDNDLGVTGVAPRAKIMAIKGALDSGYFYDSATVPAYIYAANNGADVLSMSYYSDRVSIAEGDAIKYCWDQGVLPVAAAGNASTVFPYYPAAYDETLSVAALATNLKKASFSNHGYWVDVAAPGVSLRTTSKSGGYISGFGGTSGACPHVAGLAALLFGSRAGVTAAEVRQAIEDTATPVNQAPYGVYCNYGIVNSEEAVLSIMFSTAPPRAPEVNVVTGGGSQNTELAYHADLYLPFRIHGRGLDTATTASVSVSGVELQIEDRTRDWIRVVHRADLGGPLQLRLDGSLIASVPMPNTFVMSFPLLNASTPGSGASVYGSFNETLNPDGSVLRVTRRNDGIIAMHGVFRRVLKGPDLDLIVKRSFTGTTVGTEMIQIYDWSTNSYPYGSYVTVSSGPVPQSATFTKFTLVDAQRFIDPEGTIYFRILTSDDLPSGAELNLDLATLTIR